jgi:uncharacterized protein (DUF433 family)
LAEIETCLDNPYFNGDTGKFGVAVCVLENGYIHFLMGICNETFSECSKNFNGERDSSAVCRFKRITFDPKVMGGQACIRGMRIPVSLIINLTANGMRERDILKEFPDLEHQNITEALQYNFSDFRMNNLLMLTDILERF